MPRCILKLAQPGTQGDAALALLNPEPVGLGAAVSAQPVALPVQGQARDFLRQSAKRSAVS